jgi:hypothetical protein
LILEARNHVRVRECSRVSKGASLRNIPQQPPHDLARSGLWKISAEDDVVGPGERTDLVGDKLPEVVTKLRAVLSSFAESDERRNRLAL